ncbi:type II secretion system protein, partial [Candidatus Saccharibacteria bacterium]|nr:type II secretion system protein [Candidatus Saccharibacteria bacterium]
GRRSRALAQALPALNKERNRTSQKNAFTIIEVVLVLAIAGLIFLMVFIALPALQRSQRDAQRKQDISRLLDAVQRYKSNNRGQLPSILRTDTWVALNNSTPNQFVRTYLAVDGPFRNPQGETWYILGSMYNTPGSELPPLNAAHLLYQLREFFSAVGMKCDGSGLVAAQGPGHVAVRTFLESGGAYCESI